MSEVLIDPVLEVASIATEETCDQWFVRYNAEQLARGQYGTKSQWITWISPVIGAKRWAEVTVDDVQALRDRLDDAIRSWQRLGRGPGRICGRTAMGVWWALRGAVREATTSKQKNLRVLRGQANPCLLVQPPGDTQSRRIRRKTFIYPAEFARLAASRAVPVEWRFTYAVAAYTYLRPSELRTLRWDDVDLEHGRICVSRAWSYLHRATKPPKTLHGVRDVPVDPQLMPLLRRLRGQHPADLVLPLLATVPMETLAARMRRDLLAAGVVRQALHATTPTTVRANFRSWRDSGITWLAMMGVDTGRIMRRAGHQDLGTTMGYVKQAEDLDASLGRPFSSLPGELAYAPAPRRGWPT
jgi:integrase